MSFLELKIPPPVVALVAGLVMAGLALGGFWPMALHPAWRYFAAAALFGLGVALLLTAGRLFFKAKTTVLPYKPEKTSKLIVAGVYRYSRNPMYLAMLLALGGWGVFLDDWLAMAALPLFALYMTRFQIMPEERALVGLFGVEYQDYMHRVRRWV